MDIDDYYKQLGDTKISLSPDGTTLDCFRFVESIGSGCIVISTKKYDVWYYNNAPVIWLDDWSQLTQKLIDDIPKDINWQHLALDYYENTLSEKSVANYMLEKIKMKNI